MAWQFTQKARFFRAIDVRGALKSSLMPRPFTNLADFLEADGDGSFLLALALSLLDIFGVLFFVFF